MAINGLRYLYHFYHPFIHTNISFCIDQFIFKTVEKMRLNLLQFLMMLYEMNWYETYTIYSAYLNANRSPFPSLSAFPFPFFSPLPPLYLRKEGRIPLYEVIHPLSLLLSSSPSPSFLYSERRTNTFSWSHSSPSSSSLLLSFPFFSFFGKENKYLFVNCFIPHSSLSLRQMCLTLWI